MGRLQDRKAIVTGAADGIGRATVELFVAEGATVLAVDISPKLTEVFVAQPAVTTLVQDLTTAESAANIMALVQKMGGLDILVNNAGICPPALLSDTEDSSWQQIFDVNLTSVFRLSRQALPLLKQSHYPRIINTASLSAVVANPMMGAYTASKHAVAGLSKNMALEWGEFGITVNYILPGAIVSGITRDIFSADKAFHDFWVNKAALKRLGQPEDIARAMLFLASDDASFISGHGLVVDGGALISA